MSAADRWEQALAAWAWPTQIRSAAPADPWRLDPGMLRGRGERTSDHASPADVAAQEALPRRGSVLDVGCGTGAAAAPLRARAGVVTGIDPRGDMLTQFVERIGEQPGLLQRLAGGAPDVRTVEGRWPEVDVDAHDVVVAHNVLYDVTSGVADFVAALHHHARRRVVLALTMRHPLHWVNPYAEALHGIRRPAEPTARVAADLVREVTGRAPAWVEWTEHRDPPEDPGAQLALVARLSCARADQHDQLRAALSRMPVPTAREMVALVWDPGRPTV